MNIFQHIKNINPKILLEIGAHFGIETKKFRHMLPSSTIIAFEPDPRNLEVLQSEGIDKICILEELAVSNQTGETNFYLSSGDCKNWATDPILRNNDWSASSSLKKPKEHLNFYRWVTFDKSVKVKTIKLDDYDRLKYETVDFIWMDVQGAEDLVFEGAKETLKRTRYIYTEYSNSEMYEGQLNLRQIQERLGSNWEIVQVYAEDVLLKNKSI